MDNTKRFDITLRADFTFFTFGKCSFGRLFNMYRLLTLYLKISQNLHHSLLIILASITGSFTVNVVAVFISFQH